MIEFISARDHDDDVISTSGPASVLSYYAGSVVRATEPETMDSWELSVPCEFGSCLHRRLVEGEAAFRWLIDRYWFRMEERFGHDPHYATKARFLDKPFFEYRARLFLFERADLTSAAR